MNLAGIGRYWRRSRPDEVALRFGERPLTWRDVDDATDTLAAGLAERGLARGDRLGLLLGNRVEFVELCIAAWKLGAVAVPMNVRFTPPEVAFVVEHADCRLVVTEPALAAGVALVRDRQPVLDADALGDVRVTGGRVEIADTADDDAACICYTSGTTGDPKGAVLTHGSWNVASQGWAQAVQLTTADRVLLPFPLAFTGGLAVFLFTYWAGGRLVLEPGFDPDRAFDLFERERITGFFAVPVIHQTLVDHPRWAAADLSSWRVASSGGAPVPESLIHAIQARGVPMLQGYSLTEGSAGVTVLPAHDALRKLGSAGLPVVHAEVRVVDADDRPLPAGEVGEVCVRGPQVMRGYWRNPEATAEALRGGWLHTGDLGRLDDDGYLFVVDRAKDMLISGGLNVYPAEIERVLAGLPGVVEVAVVGVPDARWGETPAVVAYTGGAPLDGDGVLAACRGVLADYKLPRYLVVRDEPLPRNMSGKVLKRDLRDRYASPAAAHELRPIR
jgi:fatty-acyl-CoA synthase